MSVSADVTAEEMRALLAAKVERVGGRSKVAELLHVSPQYMSDILRGAREPSTMIADRMGYERIVVYRRKSTPAPKPKRSQPKR